MAPPERVVFAVRGLACASCAVDVGRALGKMPGILEININYVADRGFVRFNPTETSWDTIARSLASRGYQVTRVR